MNVAKLYFINKYQSIEWQAKWIAECARKASKDMFDSYGRDKTVILTPVVLTPELLEEAAKNAIDSYGR